MSAAYWWRDAPNFGDLLAPLLLEHFAGVRVAWDTPENADIICTGSVLDVMPRSDWDGIVAGSGQLHADTSTDLTNATVLGLRGHGTRSRVSYHGEPCIGDPGLLAADLATPTLNKYPIGVVPHWTDTELFPRELARARRYGYAEPHLINVTDDPLLVVAEIGSCRKIVASSLHGVITADSFGLPRRAEPFPAMTTDAVHEGGRFKWDDYASALGQPIQFGTLQTAPKVRVEKIQHDLFLMFATIKGILNVPPTRSSSSLAARAFGWKRSRP